MHLDSAEFDVIFLQYVSLGFSFIPCKIYAYLFISDTDHTSPATPSPLPPCQYIIPVHFLAKIIGLPSCFSFQSKENRDEMKLNYFGCFSLPLCNLILKRT